MRKKYSGHWWRNTDTGGGREVGYFNRFENHDFVNHGT